MNVISFDKRNTRVRVDGTGISQTSILHNYVIALACMKCLRMIEWEPFSISIEDLFPSLIILFTNLVLGRVEEVERWSVNY